MTILESNEVQIIKDFDELEYDLSSIGIPNLFLSIESSAVYFYNDMTDFYYEINLQQIEHILNNNNNIVLQDEDDRYVFDEGQSMIIKEVLHEYRNRLIRMVQEKENILD